MRIVTYLLIICLGFIACKNDSQTKSNQTDSTPETQVAVEKVRPIVLADPEADAYANLYDDLLDELGVAHSNNDVARMKAIEAQMKEMDSQSAEIEKKLMAEELDMYNGFMDKRRSSAAEILSNLQ